MTDEREEDNGPAARRRGWRAFFRENWYRDLWLLLITGFVVAVTLGGFAEIQDSRYQAALIQCLQRNSANAKAKETFDKLTADLPEPRRSRALASKEFTVALLDAVVPFEDDCESRAHALVNGG